MSELDKAQDYPKHYVARKVVTPPVLDGKLDEDAWSAAPWTDDFVDIADGPTPRKRTRAKVLWDDDFLYVGALLEENQIWANLTEHDSVIFHDNDFEVFVDPSGSTHYYKEFEVNAHGTTWDLCLDKPYKNGGSENSRRVDKKLGYEMNPKAAVFVDGVLNDAKTPGKEWSVEIALPISGLLVNQSDATPAVGKYWRLAFSRVQWRVLAQDGAYHKDPAYPKEDNWVWQNMGEISMHEPERWGLLQFAGKDGAPLARDPEWPLRRAAASLYNAQKAWAKAHDETYASAADLPQSLLQGGEFGGNACRCSVPEIRLGPDGKSFEARLLSGDGTLAATISDDRRLVVEKL